MTTFAAVVRRLPRADPLRPRRGRPPDRRPLPSVPRRDEPGAHHPARRRCTSRPPPPARDRAAGRGRAAETDVYLTGNTVIDALLADGAAGLPLPHAGARRRSIPRARLVLVTTHRRESFGAPLRSICAAIRELVGALSRPRSSCCRSTPIPQVKGTVEALLCDLPRDAPDPAGGLRRVRAPHGPGHLILTDSGGVQEEAPSPGQAGAGAARSRPSGPRASTAGTAVVVGTDRRADRRRRRASCSPRAEAYERMANAVNPYGDGQASERIVAALEQRFG